MNLDDFKLDPDEYTNLLGKLLAHTEKLQNAPSNDPPLIPQEDLVVNDLLEYLAPVTTENGGILEYNKITYAENRSNLILKIKGSLNDDKVISFVGMHMDVVPADPDGWDFPPFGLTKSADGNELCGRGVTDCLGHVALLAVFFKRVAELKLPLKHSLLGVFIASEENSEIPGVGIDGLQEKGELALCSRGPLYWVDSADFGPTLGTAGVATWKLTAKGKFFHSGLPNKAINSIDLVWATHEAIRKHFYEKFPPTERERQYKFINQSTMKPTQVEYPGGGANQIPGEATLRGDIRTTPFYKISDIQAELSKFASELDVTTLPQFPVSPFELKEDDGKTQTGKIEFEWFGGSYEGVFVDMESNGYKALEGAVSAVRGKSNTFAVNGSLPIVGDLKKAGFDIQLTGFGLMSKYHAKNESGLLSDFVDGYSVVARVVQHLETTV